MSSDRFWEHKSLAELNGEEWEALCDGCGQCCLNKLENEETGDIAQTNSACRLLDLETCRCSNYAARKSLVPDCLRLDSVAAASLKWLPETCGYRRIAEGRPLPSWHPLLTGDPESVHKAGVSVRGRAISEDEAGDLEDHITGWIETDGSLTPFSGPGR